MANLSVVVFDNPDEAGKVRVALQDVVRQGKLTLDDSAVVVKDADGQVQVRHEMDRGVKIGIAGGGFLGLFIGFLFGGPLVSALVWAIGGGIAGSLAEMGVNKDFVNDVKNEMKPNSSALFVITRADDPTLALAALRPYEGKVIQTTLPTETEEALRRVLEKRS